MILSSEIVDYFMLVYIQNHRFNLIDSNGKVLSPRERERERERESLSLKALFMSKLFILLIKNYKHTVESPA